MQSRGFFDNVLLDWGSGWRDRRHGDGPGGIAFPPRGVMGGLKGSGPMKALKALASAAALAMTVAVTAAPAHAAVFAQFSPLTGSADYKWVNSGASNSGTGGHFFSVTSASSNVAQGVRVAFSFLDPSRSALAFIPATFKID